MINNYLKISGRLDISNGLNEVLVYEIYVIVIDVYMQNKTNDVS